MNDNKAIIASFFEAGNRGDMDACLALFADDVVWTNTGTTRFSGRFEGKETVVTQLLGPLFGSLDAGIHSSVDSLIAEGNQVVALSRGRARTKDGRPYNNSYCQVVTLRDGLIGEVTEYMDTALVDATFGPND